MTFVILECQCIELDPEEVIYPANRANVYLRMKKWSEAEADCTNALKMNPKHPKVFQNARQFLLMDL